MITLAIDKLLVLRKCLSKEGADADNTITSVHSSSLLYWQPLQWVTSYMYHSNNRQNSWSFFLGRYFSLYRETHANPFPPIHTVSKGTIHYKDTSTHQHTYVHSTCTSVPCMTWMGWTCNEGMAAFIIGHLKGSDICRMDWVEQAEQVAVAEQAVWGL